MRLLSMILIQYILWTWISSIHCAKPATALSLFSITDSTYKIVRSNNPGK